MKNSFQSLSSLSFEELQQKEKDLREALFKLRFQHGIRHLDDPSKIEKAKRDIARVHTLLSQKAKQ